jgi:phosphate transport system substrate-binding protein
MKIQNAALIAGLFLSAPALAEPPNGAVEWLSPTTPTNLPLSDPEKKAGMERGRALPTPELLQPTLDGALSAFTPKGDRTMKRQFKAAASDVLPGLVQAWTKAFQKYYPNVEIALNPPFAGSLGAKELVGGTLDFVFVSRELRPDDITDFKAKYGYDPLSVAVSGGTYRHYGFLDAVGLFVSKDNPIESLSFDQLDAILSTTHHRGGSAITTWGQLGLTGEWADKPIHVYAIKPWNGFEEFIRQRVLSLPGKRGEWRTDLSFSDVVFPVAGKVAADRYGLGYSGMAYIDAPVKMLPLSDHTGGPAVSPTYEAVAGAQYPLSRLIFFNTNRAPGKPLDPAIEEFLRFVLSKEGQQVILDQKIYLPLRAPQAETSLNQVKP